MNEQTLRVLEYDKIIEMLCREASCSLGQRLAAELRPSTDPDWVLAALAVTTEARRAWEEAGRLPLGGLHDVAAEVERARIGGVLAPEDLLRVGQHPGGRAAAARVPRRAAGEAPHALGDRRGAAAPFAGSRMRSTVAWVRTATVLDDASPDLRRLRNLLRTLQNRVRDKLDSLIHGGEHQKHLQEALVTVRNGRYVIPVKQEYKANFPGIVHDQSASGATVFIEPMAVVELNNQLRTAEAEEEEEVHRVLSTLSGLVGDEAAAIAGHSGRPGRTGSGLRQRPAEPGDGRRSSRRSTTRAGWSCAVRGTRSCGARSCRSTSRWARTSTLWSSPGPIPAARRSRSRRSGS